MPSPKQDDAYMIDRSATVEAQAPGISPGVFYRLAFRACFCWGFFLGGVAYVNLLGFSISTPDPAGPTE